LKAKDFVVLKKLGEGHFGIVYLVNHSKSPTLFAIKCISKAQIFDQNLNVIVKVSHRLFAILQSEKTTLEQINTENIISLYMTYQDDYFIYFLVEFVEGQELFEVMRELGMIDNS